jgi:hypothetical protein
MKWRWLLRCFFVGLFVVCIAAWVGSYVQGIVVDRIIGLRWDSMYLGRGRVGFILQGVSSSAATMNNRVPQGWRFEGNRDYRNYWGMWHATADYRFVGVTYTHFGAMWQFSFPLALPTVVSMGMLLLVWWRTRTGKGGRGFPVEARVTET